MLKAPKASVLPLDDRALLKRAYYITQAWCATAQFAPKSASENIFICYNKILMKMSQQLFPPLKNPPAKADTVNHRLLVQAGFVRQTMAGVYTYTTLGLAVLNKIAQIVREEMSALGSSEIHMSALHPSENWKKSGGWENIDVLFKIKSQTGKDYALGQSHEEIVTPLLGEVIKSYKDLPKSVFQIQWKFRDELRAKSGILRGREFLMKDMYSFHVDQNDFLRYYQIVKEHYLQVYKRLGLTAKATEASGGNFSQKISYEYMVLTDAGEDDIYYCPDCDYCINQEIATQKEICPKCGARLAAARASEAGNIFDLGTHYSEIFDIKFADRDNQQKYPYMGCYGIGISRCMGIIVEKNHDEGGIIWPTSVAPANVYLIGLKGQENETQNVYELLKNNGVEVIYDDRDISPGAKFAASDLVGCPRRIVLSPRNAGQLEIKNRLDGQTTLESSEKLLNFLKNCDN